MFGIVLLALLVGLIWLEIVVFGIVGSGIGVFLTIAGIFLTAAVGIRLYRKSGPATLRRMAESMEQGQASLPEIADAAAILLAATLLLIPGYATDLAGIVMFIPGLRTSVMIMLLKLVRHMAPNLNSRAFGFSMYHMNANTQGADDSTGRQRQDPLRGDADASNTTIEGDFKRQD